MILPHRLLVLAVVLHYGVNRRRVRSVSEFLAALRGADSPLRISLLRGEYRITLVIR